MRPAHSSILRCWGVTDRLLAASEMRTSSLITNDHSARCYRGKDMKIAAALIRFYFCLCSLLITFDQALRNLPLLASLPFGSPQPRGQILQLGARKTIVGDADLQDLSHCTGHIGWHIGERRANHVGVLPSSNAREGCWRSSGTRAARHPPLFLRPPLYSVGQGHVVREAPYVFSTGLASSSRLPTSFRVCPSQSVRGTSYRSPRSPASKTTLRWPRRRTRRVSCGQAPQA